MGRFFYLEPMRPILFLMLLSMQAQAQSERITLLRVDTADKLAPVALPFSAVEVLDARFDRTHIGYAYSDVFLGSISSRKNLLDFPDSLSGYLPRLLGRFLVLPPENPDTLTVLIKRFRVVDCFSNTVTYIGTNPQLTLDISASFFARHQGKYYRLFSIDRQDNYNVDKFRERKKPKHSEGTRGDALTLMLYRMLETRSWTFSAQQASFTTEEVQEALKKRFDLPLLRQEPPTGFFPSFGDFIRNRPARTDIRIEQAKGKGWMVVNAAGEPLNPPAYSFARDENRCLMYFRGEWAPLEPSDHGFRVLSYRTRLEIKGGNATNMLSSKAGEGSSYPEYFDIDMETGQVQMTEVFGINSGNNQAQKLRE